MPRAALLAADVAAAGAQFFSYGTNDLTQMTFGYSRDDVGSFLPTYLKEGILPSDPFQVLPPRRFSPAPAGPPTAHPKPTHRL